MILAVVPQLPTPCGTLTSIRGPGTEKLNSLGLAFLFATPGCHSVEKRGADLPPLGAGLHNRPLEVGRESARGGGDEEPPGVLQQPQPTRASLARSEHTHPPRPPQPSA